MANNVTSEITDFKQWLGSSYAQQYLACEREYLKNALRQVSGPRVLQLGQVIDSKIIKEIDFPQLIIADIPDEPVLNQSFVAGDALALDPAFLPIQAEMVATVIAPHVLERHTLPHQVLREAHRVLMPEGHIILTGFNPISVIGLQRLLFRRAVCPGHYFTVKRVTDWLQLLGFEVVASSTFQYAPLISNARLRKVFYFMNPFGDRWLPMLGGGYMITARKKQMGCTLVGPKAFARIPSVKKRRRKLATASSNSNNIKQQ